jgi:hypothetical protein
MHAASLLGVRVESPEGVAHWDSIRAVPGLGRRPRPSLGYVTAQRNAYPPEVRQRATEFCGVPQERHCASRGRPPETSVAQLDEAA